MLAALAQACSGSSQSSGPSGSRLELRFNGVKGARLGLLPQGCQSVDITIQPDGKTVTASDTSVSLLLPTGQHSASGVLHCNGQDFPSDKPDPVFTVPPGLGSVEVALVFGVNVQLTVVVGPSVSVSGPGIACPGDCTESYSAGTSVNLRATPSTAVFSGGCTGTGACTALMNAAKTVTVELPASPPVPPPPPPRPPPPPPPNGTIQVVNTSCCTLFAKVFVQPANTQVGGELTVTQPSPASMSVAPGNYIVRIACSSGGPLIASQGPLAVTSGNTTVFSFSGNSTCG